MKKRSSYRRGIRSIKFYGILLLITYAWLITCYNLANPYFPPAIMVVQAKEHPKDVSVKIDYTLKTGIIREVTAYTSRVEETDASPCISADGSDICKRIEKGEKLCAANFVPLGTILAIDKYGECTVVDRMNKKYSNRVDIYMGHDLERAVKFGKQNLLVKVIE